MIEIKMITSAAGPMGTFVSGKTYKVPAELANSFVGGGYATTMMTILVVHPPEPEKAVVTDIEKAAAPAEAEKAEVEKVAAPAEAEKAEVEKAEAPTTTGSKKAPATAIWGKK